MDFDALLRALRAERSRIDRVIAHLEELEESSPPTRSRRGRKSMGPEERQAVSERMKRYWAARMHGRP